jgi:hypothetical protein
MLRSDSHPCSESLEASIDDSVSGWCGRRPANIHGYAVLIY